MTPANQINGMPKMRAAMAGWMTNIILKKIQQTVVDGLVVENNYDFTFRGVIQPLSPKQIALKEEGQRAWEWLQIHCLVACPDLKVNDRVGYNGRIYKVMGTLDYSQNNYIEYHLVRDYQNE